MIIQFTKNKNNYFFEIFSQTLVLLFFLYRTVNPYFKYFFIVIQLFLIIYFVKKYRNRIARDLIDFLRTYGIPIFAFAILLAAGLNSNKVYFLVLKDIVNTVILILFFFLLSMLVQDKNRLELFLTLFVFLTIGFAFFITFHRLYFFYAMSINSDRDYNFALIPIFISSIGMANLYINSQKRWTILLLDLCLILLILDVVFSGS